MKCSSLVFLMNIYCVFSQVPHEVVCLVGCSEDLTTEAQCEFDNEEIVYMDYEKKQLVYTVPPSILQNPSEIFSSKHIEKDALKAKTRCLEALLFLKIEEGNPPEVKDPPESVLYPADEVQLRVENSLTCFVNHFYPPEIKVSWTKNGLPVSEGVSLSRYYPNEDRTFHQFSTLKFTPEEGDTYSCTVEHIALDQKQTRTWDVKVDTSPTEVDTSHTSVIPDVVCGVGLTLGLLGVTGGSVLMVKGHLNRQNVL